MSRWQVFVIAGTAILISLAIFFAIQQEWSMSSRIDELQANLDKWLPSDSTSDTAIESSTMAASSSSYIDSELLLTFSNRFFPVFSPGNIFSPVSLSLALSTLRMGMDHPDRQLFDAQLPEELASQFSTLYSRSNPHARIGNLLCINQIHQFNHSFNSSYGSLVHMASFNFSERHAVNEAIKTHFSDVTNKEVNPFIKGVRQDSSALLYDTFFFIAPWSEPFPEVPARYLNFKQSTGKERNIRCLSRVFASIAYHEDNYGQLAELKFNPTRYVFGIWLPAAVNPESNAPVVVKHDTHWDAIHQRVSMLRPTAGVNVTFPKLRQRRWLRLSTTLKRLGYQSAFVSARESPHTGLAHIASGMSLTEVQHETMLSIWERGANYYQDRSTLSNTRVDPVAVQKTLYVDRSFVFYVRDTVTNVFLVMGDFDA